MEIFYSWINTSCGFTFSQCTTRLQIVNSTKPNKSKQAKPLDECPDHYCNLTCESVSFKKAIYTVSNLFKISPIIYLKMIKSLVQNV